MDDLYFTVVEHFELRRIQQKIMLGGSAALSSSFLWEAWHPTPPVRGANPPTKTRSLGVDRRHKAYGRSTLNIQGVINSIQSEGKGGGGRIMNLSLSIAKICYPLIQLFFKIRF